MDCLPFSQHHIIERRTTLSTIIPQERAANTINSTTLGPRLAVELEPNVCVANQRHYWNNYNPHRHLVWSKKKKLLWTSGALLRVALTQCPFAWVSPLAHACMQKCKNRSNWKVFPNKKNVSPKGALLGVKKSILSSRRCLYWRAPLIRAFMIKCYTLLIGSLLSTLNIYTSGNAEQSHIVIWAWAISSKHCLASYISLQHYITRSHHTDHACMSAASRDCHY